LRYYFLQGGIRGTFSGQSGQPGSNLEFLTTVAFLWNENKKIFHTGQPLQNWNATLTF